MKTELVKANASLQQLIGALRTAPEDVGHDFAQCTKLEKRAMLAMHLHRLFGWIACRYPEGSSEALAYWVIGHAWWITGLVLQRGRRAEVKSSISAGAWQAVLASHEVPPELLAFAVNAGALKDEEAVEAFSAAVWQQLGLGLKTRHHA